LHCIPTKGEEMRQNSH